MSGLEAGSAYQIRIAAAVGGPRREGDYVWEFSTAVPELVDTNPVANAEAVDVSYPGFFETLASLRVQLDDSDAS